MNDLARRRRQLGDGDDNKNNSPEIRQSMVEGPEKEACRSPGFSSVPPDVPGAQRKTGAVPRDRAR